MIDTAEAATPPAGASDWNAGYAVVTATLTDGRTITHRVDRPRGHATRPVDDATLRTKFDDCLQHAGFEPGAAPGLFETLLHVGDQESLHTVAEEVSRTTGQVRTTVGQTAAGQGTATDATEGGGR